MRKLIAIGLISAVTMIAAPATATANTTTTSASVTNPQPPAEWRMPANSKYMKYKGLDCWRWWRITKCLTPQSN